MTATPPNPEREAIAKRLRLRGSAGPVARVSRPALIAVSAVLSIGLAGAIGWSLMAKPKAPPPAPPAAPPAPPEKLSSLPKDYLTRGDTPVLGPPLPGDLGRPILSARSDEAVSQLPSPSPAPAAIPVRAADPDLEMRQAALRSARASGLFLKVDTSTAASPQASIAAGSSTGAAAPSPQADPRTTSSERLQPPASPYVLQAGAIIPAALVTGLRSDAAGLAIAQVTQDVYDSLGGGHRLIPSGSRLIGQYDTATVDGQSRLGVAWIRLILPSGRSIVLDKLPAADPQGMAGLQDGVDRHWGRIWAAAALSTVISVGSEAGSSSDDDLTRAVRRGVSGAASDAGQQAVGKSLALTPTLTIRPGATLRVLLSKDLVLEPYDEGVRP
ncbi:conjugal transfer protein TrbI [Caulobacter flavus]|uniref:Conjugal transfer protein TrbI n=1 Tax=Caulobacter flavus TaxID=1679497 RepID=A0A2N5CPB4_9CAUL|nr:TrbI/VirB10 family protein [Caulobacter flavus]AYV48517.1 conjugal transfer protein TrbI [Caulobacter flavus]PLR08768.1 conjugal transfer protein TrbI [Caulobacter flavus]